MAKRRKKDYNVLPINTMIEVIARNGDKIYKKEMEYGEALKMPKKKGWTYQFFQLGFSQYSNIIKS